ncbi:hypothetical protein ACIQCR_16910 [Streptomyces sp. NPDC093249]|uniref:hypothetical protein n=1 Tax=unclassified Streptomyces TaxID=2593676 RepID=UPI00344B5854
MTTPPPLSLARHYYETRREVLTAAGERTTPWFRLTGAERRVAVAEASLIAEALRRAVAEQQLLDVARSLPVPRGVRLLPVVARGV